MITKIILIAFFTCSSAGYGIIHNNGQIDLTQASNSRVNQKIEIQKIKDVQYENDCAECKLDIYKKKDNKQNKSIIIFVHGGAWKIGDKSFHSRKGEFFAENGYLFIAIEYPLFPKADYMQQSSKVAQALKWTYDNAEKYNGDKENITLMGHSAGGHLVALVSTDKSYLEATDLGLNNINDTILLDSAGLDIPEIKKSYPIIFNTIYEPIFGNKLRDLQKASPINYIEPNKNIPSFLIFYGTSNKSTAPNAISFNKKLTNYDIKSEIYGIDATHEELNKNIGNQEDKVTKKIIKYLEK